MAKGERNFDGLMRTVSKDITIYELPSDSKKIALLAQREGYRTWEVKSEDVGSVRQPDQQGKSLFPKT
jgi:hypothetical protein